MDAVRFGLGLRALRRRRRWTLRRLGLVSGTSASAVQRIERGGAERVPVHTLAAVAAALGASVSVRLLWQGEGLDRLLDQAHADLVEAIVGILRADGWEVVPEASFNVDGERGSIDVLAYHAPTGSLLVIEVKSVVPDLQAMLMALDRKVRVAGRLARANGWPVSTVSRVLVLPDDRTARRRVEGHAATFGAALPSRTVAVRRWIRAPVGSIAGILFLRLRGTRREGGGRHRVVPTR